MINTEFLNDVIQKYRAPKYRAPKRKHFNTPVKIGYDKEDDQWQFPGKRALDDLPPQVAFNLACILTKRRRAFQLDYIDADHKEQHSSLVEKIKKAVKAMKPELVIETFDFSALGRGTSRRFWTIFWIPSLLPNRYIEYATKLKQVGNMDLPVLSFDDDFEEINDDQLQILIKEQNDLEKREVLVYTLIGKMLDIICPVQYFLRRRGDEDTVRVIFYVRNLLNIDVDERHEFKAQMCVQKLDLTSLSQFYTELLSFTKLAQALDMVVSMEFLPL